MEPNEFNRALKKFQAKKAKQATPPPLPDAGKVNTALPFEAIVPKPEKPKVPEAPRPRPKAMEVTITGPVELSFTVDWAGTLLGGQMNPQAMSVLFMKALAPMGRVTKK